jgi:competence protein ComEA
MKLSGVGPGTADRIIEYRQAHGPFRRVQDLEKVEGVGKGVIERNEGRMAVK